MNAKQKIFLIAGIFIILIILLFFGAVKPIISEIKKASASVKENREKLLLLEKTDQDYLKQVEADYKDISNNLSVIQSGLIDKEQAVDFFIILEEIASSTSNNLKINASGFPVLILDLEGSFPNLIKFVGLLENGKYFIDVDSTNLRRTAIKETLEGGPSSENIKANIEIKVYTQK